MSAPLFFLWLIEIFFKENKFKTWFIFNCGAGGVSTSMGVRSKYRSWRAEEVSERLVVTVRSKPPDTDAGNQWFSARAVHVHNKKQGIGFSWTGLFVSPSPSLDLSVFATPASPGNTYPISSAPGVDIYTISLRVRESYQNLATYKVNTH